MMVLGEYEFNDMFDGRFDDMPYAYAFNLALLTLLAIIGRYTSQIHYHIHLYPNKIGQYYTSNPTISF